MSLYGRRTVERYDRLIAAEGGNAIIGIGALRSDHHSPMIVIVCWKTIFTFVVRSHSAREPKDSTVRRDPVGLRPRGSLKLSYVGTPYIRNGTRQHANR